MKHFALLFALCATPAAAHQAPTGWAYPLNCCSNNDCNEIPADRVLEIPEPAAGYQVTLYKGDHEFVTQAIRFSVLHDDKRIKPSPDGVHHICISKPTPGRPWTAKLLCLFIPPSAF